MKKTSTQGQGCTPEPPLPQMMPDTQFSNECIPLALGVSGSLVPAQKRMVGWAVDLMELGCGGREDVGRQLANKLLSVGTAL